MTIIFMLAPISVLMGLIGLLAFWWTLRSGQYDDPDGDAARILLDDGPPEEDRPAEPRIRRA